MIIESIKAKNIRSIRELTLEFPASTLLFFGDIGSGKSSVLKAIEFSLFGILNAADLSGSSLLRRGENRASVELTFSINSQRYTIKRGLIRTKSGGVSQDKGAFIEYFGDELQEMSCSATDLKRKVLKILNYSVARWENKQQIPLFRYTVYTPQEQVKNILQANSDERFEILKEVFGIEKYETAVSNITILKKFLNKTSNELEVLIRDIGDPDRELAIKKQDFEDFSSQVKNLEKLVNEKAQVIQDEETKVEKIQAELNEYSTKLIEIDNSQREVNEGITNKENLEKELEAVQKEIEESTIDLKNLPEVIIETELSEEEFDAQIKSLRQDKSGKQIELGKEEGKLTNIDKLLKEGKCSLCGQKIHDKERFNTELKNCKEYISELKTQIENISSSITKLNNNLKTLQAVEKNKSKRNNLVSLIEEKQKRENNFKESIAELDKKIKKNQVKLESILKKYGIKDIDDFRDLKGEIDSRLTAQKETLTQKKKDKTTFDKELSGAMTNLELIRKELNDLKDAKLKKEKLITKNHYLTEIKNYVIDNFEILIKDIRREIIFSSAQQFNEYFKDWFRMLVEEENVDVEIRFDDFEPLIIVNGYDSPFNDLSGGEKSAVSLAYRLALNKIINERYQEVRTKDLLILDEPTDGFSQEQINKMQEVFDKLNTSQMIIISHERNLESFVTDIFNFNKVNHTTIVKKEIV